MNIDNKPRVSRFITGVYVGLVVFIAASEQPDLSEEANAFT